MLVTQAALDEVKQRAVTATKEQKQQEVGDSPAVQKALSSWQETSVLTCHLLPLVACWPLGSSCSRQRGT